MNHRKTYSLLSITVLSVALALWTRMPDFDLWSRLQVGSIVWQTGAPLMRDIFSYLPTKELWVDHEWGAGALFYLAVILFDNPGIFVAKGLLLVLTFLGVAKAAGVRGGAPGPLYLALLSWAIFPGIGSLVRSQAFSFALFAWWLYWLELLRTGRGRLWVFPVTMLAWANIHGGFLAGIGLLVLYAVGEACAGRSVRLYLLALVFSVPATLVTPYGFHLWQYMVDASLMPRPFVTEWAPVWRSPFRFWVGYLPLATLAALALVRRRSAFLAVVLLSLAALGARHQRHLVFFAMTVAALCYEDAVWICVRVFRSLRRWFSAVAAGALVIAVTVVHPGFSTALDLRRDVYPVGSLAFLQINKIKGNVAVPFNWGSITSWWLQPDCKVLIDGRYEEVYPPELFSMGADFSLHAKGWKAALSRYHADVVILSKLAYPSEVMRELPGWEPVYADEVSVVLLPKDHDRKPFAEIRPGMFVKIDLGKEVSL